MPTKARGTLKKRKRIKDNENEIEKFNRGFLNGVFICLWRIRNYTLTANGASNVRVDFCLTNWALENNVFFKNDSSKYFISQQTKADGTLTSLEELYRTDNLDLEFDGGTPIKARKLRWKRSLQNIQFFRPLERNYAYRRRYNFHFGNRYSFVESWRNGNFYYFRKT